MMRPLQMANRSSTTSAASAANLSHHNRSCQIEATSTHEVLEQPPGRLASVQPRRGGARSSLCSPKKNVEANTTAGRRTTPHWAAVNQTGMEDGADVVDDDDDDDGRMVS
mmetsp:Transcript_167511/g.532535  ORF Transcript_167511/g.532535 Transcript_167511/m.532535 type:complete len:110 (+) Transcript_167511:360-689(+)